MRGKRYVLISGILVFLVAGYIVKCLLGIDIFESYSFSKSILGRSIKPLAFAAENNPPVEQADSMEEYVTENIIRVFVNQKVARVNQKIFGNNFLGFGQHSDNGSGLWDPKWKEPVQEVLDLAKNAGISIVRFPGGGGADKYRWKDAIGNERKHFLYGIDEFLKTSEEIGAEVVYTVSYFTGDQMDAADLVEYLNFYNDGSNPNGGIDWAKERASNGHVAPYHVKYFEIGNEVEGRVFPEKYAREYISYYEEMKKVDPSIMIGVVLSSDQWNRRVMDIIKDKLDFGIMHTYPSPEAYKMFREDSEKIRPQEIFKKALSLSISSNEDLFRKARTIVEMNAGHPVPLAITEYNGGFVQDKPVPYRHSLGTALINAELLRLFMKPENNILMANYWNFVNEYWGMIRSRENFIKHDYRRPIHYIKRPNYYVFELYHKHFGDILINSKLESNFYDVSRYDNFINNVITHYEIGDVAKENLLSKEWTIVDFPGVSVIKNDDILGLNFESPQTFNYFHSSKSAKVSPKTYYKLSGYIKTENLVDYNGICLEAQDARGWDKTKFARSTKKIFGTTGWIYSEKVFRTLPKAKELRIIARRIGEKGPLKGKVFFKDVKLEKFIPGIDPKIPYLSINASKGEDGKTVYLMVVNKNLEDPVTATIELKNFVSASKVRAWILNGPGVDATNEKKYDNVRVKYEASEIGARHAVSGKSSFEFTFEPHSLTAIEIKKYESVTNDVTVHGISLSGTN